MKLCRFDGGCVGVVEGATVRDISAMAANAIEGLPRGSFGDPLYLALGELRRSLSADLSALPSRPLAEVKLLAPVASPGKIVAAPVNYQAHIAEMAKTNISPGHDIPEIGRAGLFLKATSSLVGPSQGIALRFPGRRTDHELELALVIGKTAQDLAPGQGLAHVAGYCLGLDITLRGTEDRSFRKSIDSYSVLGPWLTTADEVANPDALDLHLAVNGEQRQQALTAELIYGVGRVIEFASSFYTLHPGDVVYTGTPQGVGPIVAGDLLRAECAQLGTMQVVVRMAD